MKRLLILSAAVGTVAAALALAACGGAGSSDTPSASTGSGTATVSAQDIGDQRAVLVDSAGNALYASDQETAAGMVLCNAGCTSFWTPLTVSGSPTGGSISGTLDVVTRPDGSKQVALDGKLLYSFAKDQPGKVAGDGFEDAFNGQTLTWHVVHADGSTGSSGGGTATPGY